MMPRQTTRLSFDHLGRDIRNAIRGLWRSPGFTLVVVIVLAIATAALTTVFALLNTVVLSRCHFRTPIGS